jgi:hypothetical protein
MSSEAPYDPYIPAGGSGATGGASAQQNGNQRTAALQAVSFLPFPSFEVSLDGARDHKHRRFHVWMSCGTMSISDLPERGTLDMQLWQYRKLTRVSSLPPAN